MCAVRKYKATHKIARSNQRMHEGDNSRAWIAGVVGAILFAADLFAETFIRFQKASV